VKGYAAPESKAAVERARILIEEAEALAEPPEDPLLLFSVLYGIWVANYVVFNGDVYRDLAEQFLSLAEKQRTTVPLIMGHRLMGATLLHIGDLAEGRAHYAQALALYDPAEQRPLVARFGGVDIRVAILANRSIGLWPLGYPEAALTDTEQALKNAREVSQAPSLMFALVYTSITYSFLANYAVAKALTDELVALGDETGATFWKAAGIAFQGSVLSLNDQAADAVHTITSGITAWRSMGGTVFSPRWLSCLARAYAELSRYDDAWRYIGEAVTLVETTKKRWCEAEVYRMAGEIAFLLPEREISKAGAFFERALAVARQQQAKSWELRASISLARLWRDQGKTVEARELLAPVYGWFTEGFDTRDLKQAKALLEELAS
jgi:predicted ATPase